MDLTASARVVLLDIEGTTTPIDFVYVTLFPFARERMADFLDAHFSEDTVQKAVSQLAADHAEETDTPPPWEATPAAVSRYALWLMDQDRKATGLKTLQGLIWQDGYGSGQIKAPIYDDVLPAIQRWVEADRRVCIYSSGSVLAQKLLFRFTNHGDVTPLLSGYFDTTSGLKTESESYRTIADALKVDPAEIAFLSDRVAELDAATEAGTRVGLVVRDEADVPENAAGYPVLRDFTSSS